MKGASMHYGALRLWATVLAVIGAIGLVSVGVGIVVGMVNADDGGDAAAILLIAGPIALLFASWPLALGQGLRALAEIGERVTSSEWP
jgi:hypothetical protein